MIRDDDDFHRHAYRRRKPSWLSVGLTIGLIVALYWLQGPADAPWKNPPVVPARPDAASAPRASTTGPRDRSPAAQTARGSQRSTDSDNTRSGRGSSGDTVVGNAGNVSTGNVSTGNVSGDSNDSGDSGSSDRRDRRAGSGESSGSVSRSNRDDSTGDTSSRGATSSDATNSTADSATNNAIDGATNSATNGATNSAADSNTDGATNGATDSGTDRQSAADSATASDRFTPSTADTTVDRSAGGASNTPMDRVSSADPLPDLPPGGFAAAERASSGATAAKPTTFGLVGDRSKDGPYSLIVPKVVIRDLAGKVAYRGEIDLRDTLKRIDAGRKLAFPNDGSVFQNREQLLPKKAAGYYREWVHRTPGLAGPGPQRVVTGANGEAYYTPDHYNTFRRVR